MNDNRIVEAAVLLICREGKSRQRYLAELDCSGAAVVCVQVLMEFFRRGVYCPLCGILVDMPTYMRSSDEEKVLLADLVVHFPSLRLKCNDVTGEIRSLPFGAAYPGNPPLAVFVQKHCAAVVPREIRGGERSQQNLPALLSRGCPVENVAGVRSVTANISCGGCFLISFEPWVAGERGWLTLPELKDSTPIPVEIRWIRPWGACRSLPGMGVRFVELTCAQKAELSHLGGLNYMPEDA